MKKGYIKKYSCLCTGLCIMALGVAFSIKADLGTSPISSVPYAASLIFPLTVGTATILMHVAFISLQILLLRKQYQPLQLLQLPIALFFGAMTDAALWLLQNVTYTSYAGQWGLCAAGILLVAIGVSLEVLANAVPLAGEGLVLAVCRVAPIKFGSMKVCFDISLVLTAILIGIFGAGAILGVREGTIAAAVLVGLISRQLIGWYRTHT